MVATDGWRGWQQVSPDGEKTLVVELGDSGKYSFSESDWKYATAAVTLRNDLQHQFEDLKTRVHQWLFERADIIDRAYIGVGSDGITLIIVKRDKQFDVNFELAVSQLDIDLANLEYLNLLSVTVLSLPCASEESVRAFIKPKLKWTNRAAK